MRRLNWLLCATTVAIFLTACLASQGGPEASSVDAPRPLVLAADQGERRVRREQTNGLSSPFILKVDAQNGGSQDLVMGYEDIPPGQGIAPRRHQHADEIIFVHRGTGIVELGPVSVPFSAGTTIYIPRQVRIAMRNTGQEPVTIAFVFSRPGFEQYLRDISVPEGQPVQPLSLAERTAIRERHQWYTAYEEPGRPSSPSALGGLVLGADQGERRVRRTAGKGPFILKVDRQNGGSPDLVMGYEDIAPGVEIQPHTHPVADEILFIHRGTGVAKVDDRESRVGPGSTIYVPSHVQISVRNTGREPLGVVFMFSKPGFEQLMRDNSVLEGQPVTPMSAEERERIRKRHSWHTTFPPPAI